jgi:PelA/Pel-15E family pectate lyase
MRIPWILLAVCFAANLHAAIIGTNPPALPLTAERIAALPASEQSAWKTYLERSEKQMRADQEFFQNELREHQIKEPLAPPATRSVQGLSLEEAASWYGRTSATRIADIVLSFQTPAGGWSKNLDMTRHVRRPGERFAQDNGSLYLSPGDLDTPHDIRWNYVGTFDNDATITQMRFLAKVSAAVGAGKDAAYRASFLRGMDYIFASQYPNGGWPQVWPLQGGYHDAITYNDDATINILELLQDVASGTNEFAFVPGQVRAQASESLKRGLQCILATQIVVDGRRTVWCQQHDPLTLQPCSARNYEMPSACSSESAMILMFLMEQPNPDPPLIAAIEAAAAWFKKTELHDVAFKIKGSEGRKLVPAPGAGPLWSRYYEIVSDRPIFGDRDKSIHDDVNEISKERRTGYSWYRDTPKRVLEHCERWEKQRGAAKGTKSKG